VWEGEIAGGAAQKAKLDIYFYAANNRGTSRMAVLESAKTATAEMEFKIIFRKWM
jgi:hypothetical protein